MCKSNQWRNPISDLTGYALLVLGAFTGIFLTVFIVMSPLR